jgi:transcriptional regulator with XRE-family HTH domain
MIYFIQRASGGPIKIGYAKNVAKRLKVLQTGVSEELVVLGICQGERSYESALHQVYREYRISGEWFEPAPKLVAFIKEHAVLSASGAFSVARPQLLDPSREIRLAIRHAGISIKELVDKIGAPLRTVENWANGRINPELVSFILLFRELADLRVHLTNWVGMQRNDPAVTQWFMEAIQELLEKRKIPHIGNLP